jgi:hypothetical protein
VADVGRVLLAAGDAVPWEAYKEESSLPVHALEIVKDS